MIDWSSFNYFKKEEFECRCGCGLNNMDLEFLIDLDEARDIAQIPFKINCGVRCSNKRIHIVEKYVKKVLFG